MGRWVRLHREVLVLYDPGLERPSDCVKHLFSCWFSEMPFKRKGGQCS